MKIAILYLFSLTHFLIYAKSQDSITFGVQYGYSTDNTNRLEGGVEYNLSSGSIEIPVISISGGKIRNEATLKAGGGIRILLFKYISILGSGGYIYSNVYKSPFYISEFGLRIPLSSKLYALPFLQYTEDINYKIRTVYFGFKFGFNIKRSTSGNNSSSGYGENITEQSASDSVYNYYY